MLFSAASEALNAAQFDMSAWREEESAPLRNGHDRYDTFITVTEFIPYCKIILCKVEDCCSALVGEVRVLSALVGA